MKLFTKSSILKSTTVEIVSPKILECPSLDKGHKKLMPQGVPVEFPIFSESGEDLTIQDEENRHEQQPEERHVIEQAKAEAEQILAEARQEADHIIKEAQQIAETLKTTMEQEVRSEIIPIARAEGYEKGLKEGLEEAERLRIQSKAYLEMAQTVLVDELHKADREMVRLCLQISERIVHSALNHNPEKLLSIIRSLTLLPREKDGMRIHLSGKDWEWYKLLPPEDKPPYPVIVDESLKPGDTTLECAEGIFDARIHSQLEKIGQYLFEELDHGGLDGFNQKD